MKVATRIRSTARKNEEDTVAEPSQSALLNIKQNALPCLGATTPLQRDVSNRKIPFRKVAIGKIKFKHCLHHSIEQCKIFS